MKTAGLIFSGILITILIMGGVYALGSNEKEFTAPRGEQFEVHLEKGDRFVCTWESSETTIFYILEEGGSDFYQEDPGMSGSYTFTASVEGNYGYGWLADPENPAVVTYDAQIMPPNYVWAIIVVLSTVMLFLFFRFGGENSESF